jgi:hypothetical protein
MYRRRGGAGRHGDFCVQGLDEGVSEAVAPAGLVGGQQACRHGRFEGQHELFAVQVDGSLEDVEVGIGAGDRGDRENRAAVVG